MRNERLWKLVIIGTLIVMETMHYYQGKINQGVVNMMEAQATLDQRRRDFDRKQLEFNQLVMERLDQVK